jgi:hypothetical protein
MIYEVAAARAQAPFGGRSAISVRMHTPEIERRRRLNALSPFTGITATVADLNIARERAGERTTRAIFRQSALISTGSREKTYANPTRQGGSNPDAASDSRQPSLTLRFSMLGGDVSGAQKGDPPWLMSIEPGCIELPPAQGIGNGARFFTDWGTDRRVRDRSSKRRFWAHKGAF